MADKDDLSHLQFLPAIYDADKAQLNQKEREYNASWKRRGGTGAFHQALARKWDRLESLCARHGYDIFAACEDKNLSESVLDTVGDLRRYLALVEAEVMSRRGNGFVFKDNVVRHHEDPTGMTRPFGFDPTQDVAVGADPRGIAKVGR